MIAIALLAGFALLLIGGEATLRGAVGLGRALGLSKLLVGMVIVGIGTSLPELTVAVDAVISGYPNLAVGNVLGSSIANALFILGIAGLINPVDRPARLLLPNATVIVVVAAGVALLGRRGVIGPREGLFMLAAYVALLTAEYLRAREETRLKPLVTAQVPLPEEVPSRPAVALLLVGSGVGCLYLGADLLIEGAVGVARILGVTEGLIGLTVVSFGSTLPELVSAVVASRKGDSEVAFGNVLGSILFNLLAILGTASLAGTLLFPPVMVWFDGAVLTAACVLMIVFTLSGRGLSRTEAAVMIAVYVIYILARFAYGLF